MTIQEQFGCRICACTGIFDEHEEIGFRSCASCSGSGLSDAKILAYVKEKGLEKIVLAVGIIEAIDVSKDKESAEAYLRSEGYDPEKLSMDLMARIESLLKKEKSVTPNPIYPERSRGNEGKADNVESF